MTSSTDQAPAEALASLSVLVSMARADGVLHDSEREALQSALEDSGLPGLSLEQLLNESDDFDSAIASIEGAKARAATYAAAYSLAYADGECAEQEAHLLGRLREVFEISDAQHDALHRMFSDDTETPTSSVEITDPEKRAEAIASATRKCSIVSAVLGAFPIPGLAIATDLAVAALQVGLAQDIGKMYGSELDRKSARNLLAAFGVGTGARIAVTNLLKLFPLWGWAAGAAAAYASSWGVGRAIQRHYDEGGEMDEAQLKAAFKAGKKEGKAQYAKDKDEIERRKAEHEARIGEMTEKLERGDMTRSEFEVDVSDLDN